MNETKKLLGMRVRHLRRKRDLSQEQLAENALISTKYLGEVERGKVNISLEVAERIAASLGVPLIELFNVEHELKREVLLEKISQILNRLESKDLSRVFRIVKIFGE